MSSNKKRINKIAKIEIRRIFKGLQLKGFKKEKRYIFSKFKKIYPAFHQHPKYRNPKLLIPIIIYFYLRILDHRINKLELIEIAGISSVDFNSLPQRLKEYIERKNNKRGLE
ncbi:MAG: hypothetical protein ACFFDH_18415 [Promethearchaeota archaeon]